MSEEIQLME